MGITHTLHLACGYDCPHTLWHPHMGDCDIAGVALRIIYPNHMACIKNLPRRYLHAWQASFVGGVVEVAQELVLQLLYRDSTAPSAAAVGA